ncbi:MAG: hypothetical protein HF976_05430 [ANME-2 cluster archaeon]|nr:hypothetical protein [ANME-2 cluster archaeon]MBC2700844.1 hypothetical protein [ANME-2 cluster archaeon]MBC2709310.1 hypothetical protein [ANME-2 cluster archaeon]
MNSKSKYMEYLPSVFYETVKDGKVPFITQYLKIFEKILSGIDDDALNGRKGIAEVLDIIPELFHPRFSFIFGETSFLHPIENNNKELFRKYFNTNIDTQEFMNIYVDEFLEWLASWVALVLKEDWDIERKRKVIAGIIPIFRMRGTKKGLEEYLWIYTGTDVNIIEEVEPFQVGIRSTVGENTILGGLPPYFFIVNVDLPASDNITINNKRKVIKKIIESEKPVHTNYSINIKIEDS